MSKALLVLLGRERDKKLAVALEELERAATNRTIDAKLVGDILQRSHSALRDMHLDSDVTAMELYQALRVHEDILSADTAYTGLAIAGEVVSLHPEDIAADEAQSLQFAERHLSHFRRALADEIVARYSPHVARPRLIQDFKECMSRSGV